MKALSIRGVDPQLADNLKQQADAAQVSVNQFVLDALRKQLGLSKTPRFTREYDDLDILFGSWSEEEFQQIEAKINNERQIDEELWR